MPKIIIVGASTLDIVSEVTQYPAEDQEVRATRREERVGGNGANTARVLAGLGHEVTLLSLWSRDEAGRRIARELEGIGVDIRHCREVASGSTPTSHIVLSRATGSRTIVHSRDLPELELDDLERIDISDVDWIHFEARESPEMLRMLTAARGIAGAAKISLEIEKERTSIETMWPISGTIVFSRAFAHARGFENADDLLYRVRRSAPEANLVCTWGEQGAFGLEDEIFHVPAFVPPKVVDTLGAGDVFNAGLIDALARGATFPDALSRACRLAGEKVGRQGFEGLL
ncbi:MAG: hypothetical protein CME06_11560 [Gemmatimonadetes bacterium]|nr:hypothetical protein [Gemmatimonadota bacterium]